MKPTDTTTKWTKGPWKYRSKAIHFSVYAQNRSVAEIRYCENVDGPGNESESNAQLIASAPALWVMLQEMVDAFAPRNVRQAEAMRAAVIALRQARGEQ